MDEGLTRLIDDIRKKRRDCSRSNVIRTLVLERLAELSILTDEEKKALGVRR